MLVRGNRTANVSYLVEYLIVSVTRTYKRQINTTISFRKRHFSTTFSRLGFRLFPEIVFLSGSASLTRRRRSFFDFPPPVVSSPELFRRPLISIPTVFRDIRVPGIEDLFLVRFPRFRVRKRFFIISFVTTIPPPTHRRPTV